MERTNIILYDTTAQKAVSWSPPKTVRIYVCGITPYDSAHLGHIFTFMTYDLLQRYLEDAGHTVVITRNITDVDEPIYAKANSLGIPYTDLAARETKLFHDVLNQLNFRPLSHEPLASEYIIQMAEAVNKLIVSGYAYRLEQDIYFDTAKDSNFGSFSHFNDKLRRGLFESRGGDPDRPGKRSPYDFLLWKGISDVNDPAAWEVAAVAPQVPYGRPGWHIECSVMSSQLLGTPFDLHGGGTDLVFPHHECEIAQTRALSNASQAGPEILASRWMHVAPLHCNGEKMSKSLGNLVFAKDLLRNYEPSVIRLALMNYHFRIGGEWLDYWLTSATELLQSIRQAIDFQYISIDTAASFGSDIRAALARCLDTHAIIHALETLAAARRDPGDMPAAKANLQTDFDLLGLVL